jgi:CelD/BcsL family acetyltransferase involved in cellulose biosynthesis
VDALFDLHGRRFERQGLATAFRGEPLRALHRSLAASLAKDGHLLLSFLRQGGKDVAAYYGFRWGGKVYHFQSGIDPAAEHGSPGTVLRMLTLQEDVFGAGLAEFDFLDGDEAYKFQWATGVRRLFDVDLFRPSALGRAAALARGVVGLARAAWKARRAGPPPAPEPPAAT